MMADILRGADVICSTCVGAGGSGWRVGATARTTPLHDPAPHCMPPQGPAPLGRPGHPLHPSYHMPHNTCRVTSSGVVTDLVRSNDHTGPLPRKTHLSISIFVAILTPRPQSKPCGYCF